MSFTCPQCRVSSALEISASIQLPPDSRSDDIMLQILICEQCQFRAAAVYEESRRGALDSDNWEHIGLRIAEADLERLLTAIRSCPEPMNPLCRCPAHQALGRSDNLGRWVGLDGVERTGSFQMRLAL